MKMKQTLPETALQTLTRRTWMEWLGKAAVLSLGAGVLARCATDATGAPDAGGDSGPPDARTWPDASLPEAGVDAATPPACDGTPADFPFQPADGTAQIFQSWNVRTVDPQDLPWILDNWRVTVDGLVANPVTLTFGQILGLPRQDQLTDFHCVEGWSVYDVPWNGVHLSQLFALAQPQTAATHVTFHTIGDTYNESLPLDVALEPKMILAYGVDCHTVPLTHGFPLRVVIPRLLGYKNAKYVYRIELTDAPVNGFWVALGYPYAGEVPEDRLRPGKY
jgi:DMSO/TMAO reductase YedYZ molybdopterin-dependent catalytic subunit